MTNSTSISMSAEHNGGCVCLSVCLSVFAASTARREGGRTQPKGLFLYSSYLLVCLTVGKKTQQLCQHRQGFNTARTLRATSRPLWRLSVKIQGRVQQHSITLT